MNVTVALIAWMVADCASGPQGPYAPMEEVERNTTRAEAFSREGADLIESDPTQAEALLRETLTADIYFGPAHNNLGLVFLNAGKLYEAASEFEWARKLMPGHPDPRVNLGICLDRAGRVSEALECFEAALQVSPGYLPAIQGAALVAARLDRVDARLEAWLDEIAARSDESWRKWALGRRPRRRVSSGDAHG
jgi:tetratricopeptide (TPR) repeat protein